MSVPHDEQIRILEMRVTDLDRQVWLVELDAEAEAVASAASGAENADARAEGHARQVAEVKARRDFFAKRLAEAKKAAK